MSPPDPYPRISCPMCGTKISKHGMARWPQHKTDQNPHQLCDASRLSTLEIQDILADRKARSAPGIYVRPHP